MKILRGEKRVRLSSQHDEDTDNFDPESAAKHDASGTASAAKGDYNTAVTEYSEAIRLNPQLALYYYNRGVVYAMKGEYEKAVADWSEAIRVSPSYATAYYNRSLIYKERGEYREAIADCIEAIRLKPEFAKPYGLLAWMLAACPIANLRDGQKAVKYARKACELLCWLDPNAIDILASAYAEAGDFEQAIHWQNTYLATNLSNEDRADGIRCLKLYQSHKRDRIS